MSCLPSNFGALRQASYLGPGGEDIIRQAKRVRDGVKLEGKPEEFDDMLGFLAGEINHEAKRSKMLILNEAYEEIEAALSEHGYQ